MSISTLPRTYENALRLLSLLPTNRDVTSLFTNGAAQDLNAVAIPEMLAWLKRAGYTPANLAQMRCIHVSGTKGKGSVCAFLTAILSQPEHASMAGRVGTYMSPHVVSVRERILLDGAPIEKNLFARYVFEVWERFSAAAIQSGFPEPDGAGTKPFYFRFLTILALHVFLSEGVRSAILECGIGGEYDATNVLPAEAVSATAVTRLGLDHVAMLGETVEQIAWHKAGIFKSGVPAFTVRLAGQEGATKVLRERAVEKGARLVEIPGAEVESWAGIPGATLAGSFQKYNMALAAIVASHHLGDKMAGGHLDALPRTFTDGLKKASIRGRCETFQQDGIEWLLDGAHTSDSLAEVVRLFMSKSKEPTERRILLFNQQERDVDLLIQALVKSVKQEGHTFDLALFTRNENIPNGGEDLEAQEAAMRAMKKCSPRTSCSTYDNVTTAVQQIQELAAANISEQYRVLVTGSFHLIRPVLHLLKPGDVD